MIISLIATITVITTIFIISGSISSLIFSVFILLFGVLSTTLLKREFRKTAIILFQSVFSVYSIFALFHYIDVHYYENFIFEDEYGSFLPFAEILSKSSSISNVFRESFDKTIILGNRGYIFYIGSISYIAENYFDGFNELLLFLSSVLFGSLSSIALYRFLLFHIKPYESFKYALYFSLFSPFALYSFVLLRDIHISFFYLCGFIIISKKFSIKGLVLLTTLAFLLFNFRIENGLFFISFIIYYIYFWLKKYKLFFFILTSSIIIISTPVIVKNYLYFSNTLTIYAENTFNSAMSSEGGSFGMLIYKLPTPIKEIGILLNSQLFPFPPWKDLLNSNNFFRGAIATLHIIYSCFWFSVFFGFSKYILTKKIYKQISSKYNLLLVLAFVLIIINMANPSVRRIMVVYPLIYTAYILIRTKFCKNSENEKTLKQAAIIYVVLIILYLLAKTIT